MLIEQINNVISDIQIITDYLYQQKVHKGFELLNKTLQTIVEIADQLYVLSKEQNFQFDRQRLLNNLTMAMSAMEAKDNVLLADILVYEIAGHFLEILD